MTDSQRPSNGFVRELAVKEADRRLVDASERLKYATEYAQGGLKGLFLANGASIVALLTFLGNAKDLHIYTRGIWSGFTWFSLGLAAASATYILGYIFQASYMQASLHISMQADSVVHETGQTFDHKPHEKRGGWAENWGIALAVASLVAFVTGAFVALNAII